MIILYIIIAMWNFTSLNTVSNEGICIEWLPNEQGHLDHNLLGKFILLTTIMLKIAVPL